MYLRTHTLYSHKKTLWTILGSQLHFTVIWYASAKHTYASLSYFLPLPAIAALRLFHLSVLGQSYHTSSVFLLRDCSGLNLPNWRNDPHLHLLRVLINFEILVRSESLKAVYALFLPLGMWIRYLFLWMFERLAWHLHFLLSPGFDLAKFGSSVF